jgi:hypothetical protein
LTGRSRTSFEKLQKERRRQEKQAAKRARRHGTAEPGQPEPGSLERDDTDTGLEDAPPGVPEPEDPTGSV